jgi:UDP-N-acetyl-alpha-D-quinovosamine dehydrogenase
MAHIVVLGAGGFIGGQLAARLAGLGLPVRAVTRRPIVPAPGLSTIALGDLGAETDWGAVLEGAHGLVHLASAANPVVGAATSADWVETEIAAARHLARAAGAAGLRQLVLVSSIKVHGEASPPGAALTADSPLAPEDAYAVAKLRTEQAIVQELAHSETALAVIRPPLVYGPGVKGGFLTLLKLIGRAPALPFASIESRRSLIYRENLIDLIVEVLRRPEPVRGIFLARDGESLSTPELIRRIGRQFGRTPLLFPCPVAMLSLVGRLIGRPMVIDRLTRPLEIDDRSTREALDWAPRVGVDAALGETCRWFLEEEARR